MADTAVVPPTSQSLGDAVSALMGRLFSTLDHCDWVVAVDHRDGSVAVVYRTNPGWPQTGVRGTTLYRWLCALRDAGFTADPRTDMEVFGRPDEISPIAWWIHVAAATTES